MSKPCACCKNTWNCGKGPQEIYEKLKEAMLCISDAIGFYKRSEMYLPDAFRSCEEFLKTNSSEHTKEKE